MKNNTFKNKKVIVTGGAGFIGSHVVDALIGEGADVHVIDNLSGGKKENINPKAVFHEKDIRNFDEIKDIFRDAVFVFHLAALPRVQFSLDFPLEAHDVNAFGTMKVLEAARQAKVSRVIYSASSAAYGDQVQMPLVETMPAIPKSPYGLQKYESELMCKLYSDVYGLSTVCLRYFNVFGPRLDPEGAYALVIGKFLKQRKEGKPITITGDGEQTRDFTHIRDVVRANLLAALNEKVGKGESINIGAGKNATINKVAALIGGPVEHIPPRLEPKHTLADNSLAKKLLGWTPEVTLEEGIQELKKIWGIS